jgi:ectoine hydroxylase
MTLERITDRDFEDFWRDGYVLKRGFFDTEETALLRRAVEIDEGIRANIFSFGDSKGAFTELALWNHPSDDIFGAVARCERVVGGMERLLGGEIYHYHSKLTMKRPRVGGAFEWHQDYGYWYNNACLFPDMASVFIALDPATRENGCLQVLKGSHRLGRLDHGRVGGQTGADMERVEQAMKVLEHVYVEMAPGDALFFHANTLHTSSQNLSDAPRNALLCAYNRASNNPYKEHHHPRYTPLTKVPDTRVKEVGLQVSELSRSFLDPADDKTVAGRRVERTES